MKAQKTTGVRTIEIAATLLLLTILIGCLIHWGMLGFPLNRTDYLLARAHLRRGSLMCEQAPGVYLAGVDFYMEDLCLANLEGSILSKAKIRNSLFCDTDLRNADLRAADLQNSSFRSADLRGADLRGARLDNADLWEADLRGAKLDGAIMTGAYYDEYTRWSPGVSPQRYGARFVKR
jgi:uncharacterized protein YjbI with pentapeptide repeats